MNWDPNDDPWNAPAHDPRPAPAPPPGSSSRSTPLPSAAPPRPTVQPRFKQLRLTLAWAAIALGSIVIGVLQFIAMNTDLVAEPDPSPSLNALYMGRVSVGMQQALGQTDPAALPNLDALANQSAYPATNALRNAILAGELVGPDEALSRVASVQPGSLEPPETDERAAIAKDRALLMRVYGEAAYVPAPAERNRLIDRHGWFGKLAAGYHLAPSNPVHAGPRDAAATLAVLMIAMVGVALLATAAGLVLLIVLIVLLLNKKVAARMPTGPTAHATAYLETPAVFILGFLVLQGLGGLLMVATGLDPTPLILLALVLPVFWPLLWGVRFGHFRVDMGWVAPRGVLREIGAGLVGYVAGLPIIALGILATLLLAILTGLGKDHPIGQEMLSGEGWQAVILVLAAVVWAPLVEECIFRGAMYRHLRNPPGWVSWLIASGVSSFIFAAIHPQGIVGIPALMAIAFVLAGLRELRQSLIPCITAHALHNGTIMAVLMAVLYL